MKRAFKHVKGIAILFVICLLIGIIAFLAWDDNKSSCELIQINESFLQEKADSLPIPKEKVQGEQEVKQKGLKGIVLYDIAPITEQEAQQRIEYFKTEEQRYKGLYTPLNHELTGAFIGEHRYTSIVEKWGYGWYSYDGNLYADYYGREGREKAKGKPNYRNRYNFSFVKDNAVYNVVVFCNQQNPEKALSGVVQYISTLIE